MQHALVKDFLASLPGPCVCVCVRVAAAAAGAKVQSNAIATLLPNLEGKDKGAEVFRIMSVELHDDKQAFEFLCPLQVGAALAQTSAQHTLSAFPST